MKPLDPITVTLLIDMDAILVDILKTWLSRINKDYNQTISLNNITDWNITNCIPEVPSEQIMRYLYHPGFFKDLDPVPGATENLKKLFDEGFDIWIVTAPPYDCPYSFSDKLAWVADHIPFISQDRVIFAKHKDRVKGDILFDDAPHNLESFSHTAVAMDYPFNQGYQGPRVKNWNEFYQFAQDYKAKREEAQARADWGVFS